MPRPKLLASERLTEVTFVKFRKDERRRLDRISKRERKSRSKILREGFHLYEKHPDRTASRRPKQRRVA
jgi:hypothetical protein